MRELAWGVFQSGGAQPAKLAFSLKDYLVQKGVAVERVVRTDWGFRLELKGLTLDLADHPVEPGLIEIRLRQKGGLGGLLARARFAKVADAVADYLAEHPGLRLVEVEV